MDLWRFKMQSLEAIIGPMFAGKTTELLNREYAYRFDPIHHYKTLIFKPSIDKRYSETDIATHDGKTRPAIQVGYSLELEEKALKTRPRYVFIDEIQFFDEDIIGVVKNLLREDIGVVFTGLNLDYRGEPFKFRDSQRDMGELLIRADDITTLYAKCKMCGKEASKTYRKSKDSDIVIVGGADIYEPRCNRHFTS